MGICQERSREGGCPLIFLNIIKAFFNILSSKASLLWIIGGWIIFYISLAIWTDEAFLHFATGLEKNLLIQIPYALFLISGYLNTVRTASRLLKEQKTKELLMWIFLPLGALLFFTGFFVSSTIRQMEHMLIMENDLIRPSWGNKDYKVVSLNPGIRERLTDSKIDKGIFAYEPKIIIADESSNAFEIGAFPPARVEGTYYHILNFGIAPGVIVNEGDEKKIDGYMALMIRTPGSSDFFDIPSYPYRVLVSIEPLKNKKGISSIDIKKDFSYKVRIFKGEKVISEGDPYKGVKFDNLTLYFFEPVFWVQLSVVKDSGVLIIVSGIFMIAIGLPLSIVRLIRRLMGR